MNKKFALTGVGGYIAPRHLKAIKDTRNTLVAAVDPSDSVGVIDHYFPDASFFREFERFDRHLEKLRRKAEGVDYISICSPNFLHDAHIRLALRVGAHAICEKPLVLNPWNIDMLEELAGEYGRTIYTVLQLRLHPALVTLKQKYAGMPSHKKHVINLTYITSRGKWYLVSWKGNLEQSGGLVTNIGIHFFDMLIWIFGSVQNQEVHISAEKTVAGYIELERAEVHWFLSIDRRMLPPSCVQKNQSTFRSITIDGEEVEFSEGFTDLHTRVYEDILGGGGFLPRDVKPSITLAHAVRNAAPIGINARSHAFLNKVTG